MTPSSHEIIFIAFSNDFSTSLTPFPHFYILVPLISEVVYCLYRRCTAEYIAKEIDYATKRITTLN